MKKLRILGAALLLVIPAITKDDAATKKVSTTQTNKLSSEKKSNKTKADSSSKKETKNSVLTSDAIEHDKIAVTIYPPTDGNPIILTKKDINKLSINGTPQTREELIFKEMCFDFATNVMKTDITSDRAEKQIEEIMHHHNLSREHMKATFKQFGYTYKQALDELTKIGIVEQLLQYKIKSRVIVSDDDIAAYYKDHPEYQPAEYTIVIGFISQDAITDEQVDTWNTIKDLFDTNGAIEWSDEVVFQDDEIAAGRSYIRTLPIQKLSPIEVVDGGYEVVKVIKKQEKRLKTLEESSLAIALKLRQQMFDVQLAAYKEELLQEYEVIYHD